MTRQRTLLISRQSDSLSHSSIYWRINEGRKFSVEVEFLIHFKVCPAAAVDAAFCNGGAAMASIFRAGHFACIMFREGRERERERTSRAPAPRETSSSTAVVSLISPLHEVCSSIAHDHVVQSNALARSLALLLSFAPPPPPLPARPSRRNELLWPDATDRASFALSSLPLSLHYRF